MDTIKYIINEVIQDKRFTVRIMKYGPYGYLKTNSSHLSLSAAIDQIIRLQKENKDLAIFHTVPLYGSNKTLIRTVSIYG